MPLPEHLTPQLSCEPQQLLHGRRSTAEHLNLLGELPDAVQRKNKLKAAELKIIKAARPEEERMNNWDELMQQEMDKGYLQDIRNKLEDEYAHKTIYPAKENIFRALEETPIQDVKVVILGQDPYINPNQAQGFAFSVPKSTRIPPSLQNIYKELAMEYQQDIHRSGDLSDWAKQGVLLLNPILTVEAGKSMSHGGLGWQRFTDAVIDELNKQDQPIVFLLWGAQARKVAKRLDNPNHLILESPHPSPLSASRGFFGSNHFLRANDFLQSKGVAPIDWIRDNTNDPEIS